MTAVHGHYTAVIVDGRGEDGKKEGKDDAIHINKKQFMDMRKINIISSSWSASNNHPNVWLGPPSLAVGIAYVHIQVSGNIIWAMGMQEAGRRDDDVAKYISIKYCATTFSAI